MTFSFASGGGELKRPAKPTVDSKSKKDSERKREYRSDWEKDFEWLRYDKNKVMRYRWHSFVITHIPLHSAPSVTLRMNIIISRGS